MPIIEMIRFCPKCGAYYAEAATAFCLVDGAPLVKLDPASDKWSEGTRSVEEKARALRKQQRKVKWRRIATLVTTVLMATTVVCVVTINTLIYLKPPQSPLSIADSSPTPTPTPSSTPSLTATPTPTPTATPTPSPTPTPTATATPTPTPTPIRVFKISGLVTYNGRPQPGINIMLGGTKSDVKKTDPNGRYTFSDLPAGGRYTITPEPGRELKPGSWSANPLSRDELRFDFSRGAPAGPTLTPTPWVNPFHVADPTPTPTPTPIRRKIGVISGEMLRLDRKTHFNLKAFFNHRIGDQSCL